MDQIMIDIEDNENSGYFPIQVFEVQSEPRSAAMIIITDMPGANEPYDVVGWSSTGGGTACEATAVTISDSGSGQATMIHGGDFGAGVSDRRRVSDRHRHRVVANHAQHDAEHLRTFGIAGHR